MRPSVSSPIDTAQASLVHEVAMAAELSYLWGSQLHEALDSFSQAARAFMADVAAGKNPDPLQLLVRYGAANELLNQLNERFDIGGEALAELRFGLVTSDIAEKPAEPGGSVLFLRPERGGKD